MHKLAKQIAECLKSKVEGKGIDNLNLAEVEELKSWSEIIKNIVCYDKDYRIIEAMDKEEKEEEESEKYFLKMLKEEYGMEDEEARRFYRGQPRSKTSGRFMSRGDGRRNYTTPYYHIPPYMRNEEDMEYYRDMDRNMGKMYYSDGRDGNASNSGSESRGSYGDMSGGRRGYGKTRFNDGTSTRYEMAKRNYTETKELHKGNTAEDKQLKMKELEKYMTELGSDISEMISDASNEEKTLLKNKLQVLAQKVV